MDYFMVFTLSYKLISQDPTQPVKANLPTKHFYWCSSQNFIFSSLPFVKPDHARQLIELGTLFSGEFDTVLIES